MELSVINTSGKETGKKVNLAEAIYSIEPNDHAIYLDVKQYLANQRQGTHKSKERNEVAGSTKKIKKQKGTGGARAGSIKSGVFVGGGRIFGPRPRNYSFKLNKKVKQLARKSALTYKFKESNLVVIEDFNLDAPKTQNFVSLLEKISLASTKTLVVIPENNENIFLSSRNLKNSKVVIASDLNTYDVLNAQKLVLLVSSVEKIESILS
jgi:large subunit ribosomal protein L4